MELTKNDMIEVFRENVTNPDNGTIGPTPRADKWIMAAIRRAVACVEDGALQIDKDSAHQARYWVGVLSHKGTIVGNRSYPDMVTFVTSKPVADILWNEVVSKYGGAK